MQPHRGVRGAIEAGCRDATVATASRHNIWASSPVNHNNFGRTTANLTEALVWVHRNVPALG